MYTFIPTVFRTDRDVQSHAVLCPAGIQYSIVYWTRDWFRIDQSTGNIYTKAPLDREAQQFVLLGVRAQTTRPQVLYSTAQVRRSVLVYDPRPPPPLSVCLQSLKTYLYL